MAFLTWDRQDALDFAEYVESFNAPKSWREGAGAVRLDSPTTPDSPAEAAKPRADDAAAPSSD